LRRTRTPLAAANRNLKVMPMFIVTGRDEYAHAAVSAALFGTPIGSFESLADWAAQQKAKEEAAKVVSFASWREKLRPSAAVER
jgi:hypothetical protein